MVMSLVRQTIAIVLGSAGENVAAIFRFCVTAVRVLNPYPTSDPMPLPLDDGELPSQSSLVISYEVSIEGYPDVFCKRIFRVMLHNL